MTANSLMVLGSMSSAGKSLLVTGLCRLYARRGWRVTPFKAQNMSNNAAVCAGGEIGRAQAAQAYAAGIEPSVAMNPVLLKPEADSRSQVVVRGQVWETFSARDYYTQRDRLWQAVTDSIDTLKSQYDLMIMEGAGSPAEMNLITTDMVNLAAARYAHAPSLLVGDVDRGGVFAQLLGTLWLLDAPDRALIRGLVVNKFRGDISLFTDGVRILEERGGIPVVGVVPYIHEHGVAEEDAASIEDGQTFRPDGVDIAVIHTPHISNFDDLDPLIFEPQVQVRYVRRLDQLGRPRAVILPGTKNTLGDMQWLHESGLAEAICALAANGVCVMGLCGGYQMLGDLIVDEDAVESNLRQVPGLGLLPGVTRFKHQKTTTRSVGQIRSDQGFLEKVRGETVSGYEIHMGETSSQSPFCLIEQREGAPVQVLDGTVSNGGAVWGTYLHGIFDNDNLRKAWVESLGAVASPIPFLQRRSQAYDHLADVLESSMDLALLDRIIEQGV